MKKFILLVILLLFSALLFSCTPENTPSPVPTEEEIALSYPAPAITSPADDTTVERAYPITSDTDIDDELVELIIPTATSDRGVIHGLLLSTKNDIPIEYSSIYLGQKTMAGDGESYFITYQLNSSPNTISNGIGAFVIDDIPPGEYVLILVTPFNTYPVMDKDMDEIEIFIEGGEVIDLGNLYARWLDFD